jgi:hypothetical protein
VGRDFIVSYQGLTPGVPIVDTTGAPTPAFIVYMQQVTSGISNSSGASMPTPSPVSIYADYTGAYLTGQLPRTIPVQRFLNGDDVSTRTRWFLSTLSGSITATIDQTGVIAITALGSSSVLQVQSNRDKVTLTCNVTVNRVVGTPPTISNSGGTDVSTTSFNTINSSVYAAITDPLTVTVGSSGTVTLNAPLNVTTAATSPAATIAVFGKWQWLNGATWTDVGTEIQSDPDCQVEFAGQKTFQTDDGVLTVNQSQSGLTVGASVQFRLMARTGGSTRTMIFTGTASAIP